MENDGGVYGLINLFSGGALLQLTVFALGIMPYITASIILQLLVVVIPRLETLKKEGQAGQTKITQYTRYLTLALAILQATGIVALARAGQLLQGCTAAAALRRRHRRRCSIMVITMTAGTARHHVARRADHRPRHRQRHVDPDLHPGRRDLPVARCGRSSRPRAGRSSRWSSSSAWSIIAAVIFMEQGQRRIPVQYARRMVGRKMYGGSSTYIPLKVNQAGIIPVIFASSLLYLPALATQFDPDGSNPITALGRARTSCSGDHPLYMARLLRA